jgi:kynureninase
VLTRLERTIVDRIIQAISPENLVSPIELERRGGTLILDFRDRNQDMIKRLRDAHVQFDVRAKGIRLSPYLCNNGQQIDALIKLLN